MLRKIFRTGNSMVVSLPREALDYLGISEGSEVSVELDREQCQLVLTLASTAPPEIDQKFARQVDLFIERYRPALEALAE